MTTRTWELRRKDASCYRERVIKLGKIAPETCKQCSYKMDCVRWLVCPYNGEDNDKRRDREINRE